MAKHKVKGSAEEAGDAPPKAAVNSSVPPSTTVVHSFGTADLPSFHQPRALRGFKVYELLKK